MAHSGVPPTDVLGDAIPSRQVASCNPRLARQRRRSLTTPWGNSSGRSRHSGRQVTLEPPRITKRSPWTHHDRRIDFPLHRRITARPDTSGRECPFGRLRSSVIPDAEAHVWRGTGWGRRVRRRADDRSRRRIDDEGSGGTSGMLVGSPRYTRKRTITAGSAIRVISVRRLPHREHASTSIRCRNDASKPSASPPPGTPHTYVTPSPLKRPPRGTDISSSQVDEFHPLRFIGGVICIDTVPLLPPSPRPRPHLSSALYHHWVRSVADGMGPSPLCLPARDQTPADRGA